MLRRQAQTLTVHWLLQLQPDSQLALPEESSLNINKLNWNTLKLLLAPLLFLLLFDSRRMTDQVVGLPTKKTNSPTTGQMTT